MGAGRTKENFKLGHYWEFDPNRLRPALGWLTFGTPAVQSSVFGVFGKVRQVTDATVISVSISFVNYPLIFNNLLFYKRTLNLLVVSSSLTGPTIFISIFHLKKTGYTSILSPCIIPRTQRKWRNW